MASHDNRGINTTSLANNLSQIDGVTDTNDQAILENTEITLPKILKLNNLKYKINKDGDVIISNPRIPDEFQEVEYIESDRTQHIETSIYPSNKWTGFEINFYITEIVNNYGEIFGYFHSPALMGVLRHNNGNQIAFYGSALGTGTYGFTTGFSNKMEAQVTISWVNNTGTLSGLINNVNVNETNIGADNSNQIPLYLMRNMAGYWYSGNKFTYDGIVHEFVPCYCITTVTNAAGVQCTSSTKGLYDLENGKFYTNANTDEGAVDFTAGPEI